MLELKTTTLQSLGTAILTLITVCILFVAESQIVFWVRKNLNFSDSRQNNFEFENPIGNVQIFDFF